MMNTAKNTDVLGILTQMNEILQLSWPILPYTGPYMGPYITGYVV